MVVHLQRNCLNLLYNEMDLVYILNIKFKKKDIFCASYSLYIPYLAKMIVIDFNFAVLNLYYQRFSQK